MNSGISNTGLYNILFSTGRYKYFSALLLLLLQLNIFTGCSQYKLVAKGSEPATDVIKTETIHSILWGLVLIPPVTLAENCQNNGLAESTVKTNFWYTAVSVITMGIYTPVQVTWRCAKDSDNTIDIGKAPVKQNNNTH